MSRGVDLPAPELRERGADRDGEPQWSDRRLFMQLTVLESTGELTPTDAQHGLCVALGRKDVQAVVYEQLDNPVGIGLLTWSTEPAHFITGVRPVLQELSRALRPRAGWAMFGRTYSTGFERDLEHWLLRRPIEAVLAEENRWAIWYPLRRKGSFERLAPDEKGQAMREHGGIGRSYGDAGFAHDIRLACHGLDPDDNDFVIGLVGKALHPLSHCVQAMRGTRQTAEFMEKMGPFFVGRTIWRNGKP